MAAEGITGTAVYLTPGMQIKIECPVNGRNKQGFFARREATEPLPAEQFSDLPSASAMIRGFVCEDSVVGTIEPSDATEAAVIYTHNQPYGNSIWFFARTGELGLIKIVTVPIHDHSTIVHGGPAYGTYFDDDIER